MKKLKKVTIRHEAATYAAYDEDGHYVYGAQKPSWLYRWLDNNDYEYEPIYSDPE